MATLDRNLRRDLESAVKKARRVAEAGARQAIEQLAVSHQEPWSALAPEQRKLRNRLRAHGRQLGDRLDERRGTQPIDRLAGECAYEHWHRLLFARFLAENDLLVEPESEMPLSLDECRELARERGVDWLVLASDFAQRMLPQIFRAGDPVLDVALPPEKRQELEAILEALPRNVFVADDSLGWVYQFWQAEQKDAVNVSESKIGADELPAVTQLFTEDYMVLFLLHNTLGAWWAGKVLAANPSRAESAASEHELRAACAVGDVEWTYLRFVREEGKSWRPTASAFDGWPKAACDITLLDPCMGSGHFLVFALPMLAAMRAAEEGLAQDAAIEVVLRDNLFGLEIDPRCTQIAAFNLALAAWRRIGFRQLPALHLACSGLSLGVSKAEWLGLAERAAQELPVPPSTDLLGTAENLFSDATKRGFERLYDLFVRAPWLGSLIDPRSAGGDLIEHGFADLEPLLARVMAKAETAELTEMAVAAKGLAKAAEILAGRFTLVATNPPFLGELKQDDVLRNWCGTTFPLGKADLSTVVLLRALRFARGGGSVAFVTPEEWLFLKRYSKLRKQILSVHSPSLVVRLGYNSFLTPLRTAPALSVISDRIANRNQIWFGSVSDTPASLKPQTLRDIALTPVAQIILTDAPGMRLMPGSLKAESTLRDFATTATGMLTGDNERFFRFFWEVDLRPGDWVPLQSSPTNAGRLSGREQVVYWQNGAGELAKFAASVRHLNHVAQNWRRGQQAWGKEGVVVQGMGRLLASPYVGDHFDNNCFVLLPIDDRHLDALRSFCVSEEFYSKVRAIDTKSNITRGDTFLDVAVDLDDWVVESSHSDVSAKPALANEPDEVAFSDNVSKCSHPLHVAVAQLLGFVWPQLTGVEGRGKSESAAVSARHTAPDGIVCLTSVKGEIAASQRITALLADTFGNDWSAPVLARLLSEVGLSNGTLDDWLRDSFFEQHCVLFHQRPFIWHIWDGRRDGFHALVNCHRLGAPNGEGRRTLEKLLFSYLGDWIDRQRADQKALVEGADGRVAAAEHLKTELTKILAGERPYDIFVRWKPLAEQPTGWEPDITDGVRINIRPFMTARPLGARAKNACILRVVPKITWQKDRGKEPMLEKAEFPWFWGWDEQATDFVGGAKFDGNRWNDLHYSRAVKIAARERAKGGKS